ALERSPARRQCDCGDSGCDPAAGHQSAEGGAGTPRAPSEKFRHVGVRAVILWNFPQRIRVWKETSTRKTTEEQRREMHTHLSPQLVERYLARQLTPLELLEADDHLATCADCCRLLAAPANAALPVNGLQQAVLMEEENAPYHLAYEDMERYVD